MRASPLWLLALVPWLSAPPAHAPVAPETSLRCALAIEVHLKAPLAIGTLDVRVMTGDVEPPATPYGVTFCWGSSPDGCDGLEVRIGVVAIEDGTLAGARATRTDLWISN